jgi:hypothetical protein
MSIIYTDDKGKPLRTKLSQRNNKFENNLILPQPQQQQQPNSPIINNNDIYSNTDLISLNTANYRQQSNRTTNNNLHPNRQQQQMQDLDRMSLGSISMPIDDIPSKIRRTSVNESANAQRRTSFLRKHWQQHSDVPFVIGADVTNSSDGTCEKILSSLAWFLLFLFFPFSLFFTLKVVQEYE